MAPLLHRAAITRLALQCCILKETTLTIIWLDVQSRLSNRSNPSECHQLKLSNNEDGVTV